MSVAPEIHNRMVGMVMISMIVALTSLGLFAGGESAQAENTEIGVLTPSQINCYSMDTGSSILGMGEGSSVEPHALYYCKVKRRWKICQNEVYVSTPNGSYWKCTKWKYYTEYACTPKSHVHNNEF